MYCSKQQPFALTQARKRSIISTLQYLFGFILLVVCMSSCNPEKQQMADSEIVGSLFIIGGGSRPPELVARMIRASGVDQQGYVVILPMSSAEPDSAIIWSGEQFIEHGITSIAGFNFLPGEPVNQAWVDSIRHASLIYISGGDQNRFMQIVLNTPIMDAIIGAYKHGAMVAGTSAGAAVMSEKMITGNEKRYPDYNDTFRTIETDNIDLAPGLGLISTAIIDQHFVWRSRHNRLISAVLEFPDLLGIGIDESTAILVRGNSAEVVGLSQVLVYKHAGSEIDLFGNKPGTREISLGVYIPGQSFSLQ